MPAKIVTQMPDAPADLGPRMQRLYATRFAPYGERDAYLRLINKEGLQAALQKLQLETQREPAEEEASMKIAKALSLGDIPAGARGGYIAQVTKSYPGLPLKEALKRFGEKGLLPPPPAPKKPAMPKYPEIKVPKFPAMKFAAEEEDHRLGDAAMGGLALAGSAAAVPTGLERALGSQAFIHGTSTPAAESILEQGLLRERGGKPGGSAAAVGAEKVIQGSTGRVHVADTSPLGDAIAQAHARLAEAAHLNPKITPEQAMHAYTDIGRKGGPILGGAMPYREFAEHFEADPDMGAPGAFRSATTDIPAARIHRGRPTLGDRFHARDKDLLGYAMKHPGRALTGAGLLAGAGAGVGYGASKLRDAVMGRQEKTALDLQFNSQEDAQAHLRNRGLAGAAGSLVGGGLGGMVAGKRFGAPGAIVGGMAGAMLGSAPGKLLADVAHDIPQRTGAMYDNTTGRMDAAAGYSTRLASAMPSVSEFLEFAASDNTADPDAVITSGFEEDLMKRLKPMGLGADSSLEGGDTGQRNEQMGLPKYDGV